MTERIKVISSMATKRLLHDLAELYERQTACAVELNPMGGIDAARSVRAGVSTDIVVLASNVMEQLETEGHIVTGSRKDFVRSDIAVAVRSGCARPAIHDEASVKRAIMDARKFCFSTGPSGDHLKRMMSLWGIADATSRHAIEAPAGVPVGEILARGDADLGFQQLSELLDFPGVDIVGPLPPEIQATTIFSAGTSAASVNAENAHALIEFLISPETETVKQQHGMKSR